MDPIEQEVLEKPFDWHWDPMNTSAVDAWKVGNVGDLLVGFVDHLKSLHPSETRTVSANRSKVRGEKGYHQFLGAAEEAGYDHNTMAVDMFYYAASDLVSDTFKKVEERLNLVEPYSFITSLRPGKTFPIHSDQYDAYLKMKGMPPEYESKVIRHTVYLQDWVWGLSSGIGNTHVQSYRAGDTFEWIHNRILHYGVNATYRPVYKLQIFSIR